MDRTKKEIAFELFEEGKLPTDPEVKALGLKGKSKNTYYYEWQKSKGISSPETLSPAKNVLTEEDVSVEIEPDVSEIEPVYEEDEEEEVGEEEEEKPRDDQDSKDDISGNGKKPINILSNQGLTFRVNLSTKTLMLYQIAASRAKEPITLGDFVDDCVEDYFIGRGYELGLVKIQEVKK